MNREFFAGFLLTIAFVAVVIVGLFGIFVLINVIAGPVGG